MTYGSGRTYLSSKGKLPQKEHFAVIVYSQHYVAGDQRSIDTPGHGYPGGYESSIEYIAFDSEEDLKQWIRENQRFSSGKSYDVISAKPVKIETEIQVKVS